MQAERRRIRASQETQEQTEKARTVENFMFLRFVKLLIRTNRNIEDAKTALFNHSTFTMEDSFAYFDIN
jgi:hypothetical protein